MSVNIGGHFNVIMEENIREHLNNRLKDRVRKRWEEVAILYIYPCNAMCFFSMHFSSLSLALEN